MLRLRGYFEPARTPHTIAASPFSSPRERLYGSAFAAWFSTVATVSSSASGDNPKLGGGDGRPESAGPESTLSGPRRVSWSRVSGCHATGLRFRTVSGSACRGCCDAVAGTAGRTIGGSDVVTACTTASPGGAHRRVCSPITAPSSPVNPAAAAAPLWRSPWAHSASITAAPGPTTSCLSRHQPLVRVSSAGGAMCPNRTSSVMFSGA